MSVSHLSVVAFILLDACVEHYLVGSAEHEFVRRPTGFSDFLKICADQNDALTGRWLAMS